MAAKSTFVWLAHKVGDVRQKFEYTHAQRIIALRKCAWVLDDEKFELKSDGTIVRRNKKKDSETPAEQ